MKPIVHAPLPVLSTKAATIVQFDKKLLQIIEEMKDTLVNTTNPKGVGLAAPQIGLPLRLFITKPSDRNKIRVFINPHIISHSDKTTGTKTDTSGKLEGCLSIPNLWGKVRRAKSLTLSYQDETGASHTESFTGFMATIIQHETDHTNGILFTQRVLEQQGTFYETTVDKNGEETLSEVRI
jgi:peptide deformylase